MAGDWKKKFSVGQSDWIKYTKDFWLKSFNTESTITNSAENENINIPRRKIIDAGTKGEKIKEVYAFGRPRHHFTFKENNGPTGFANKSIVKGNVK